MQTPANWTVVSTGPARIPRIESEGAPIALMFQESAHHAALIAAAPDLVAALQACADDLLNVLSQRMAPNLAEQLPSLIAARAALSKALGE